jgi:hypothetical protein
VIIKFCTSSDPFIAPNIVRTNVSVFILNNNAGSNKEIAHQFTAYVAKVSSTAADLKQNANHDLDNFD